LARHVPPSVELRRTYAVVGWKLRGRCLVRYRSVHGTILLKLMCILLAWVRF